MRPAVQGIGLFLTIIVLWLTIALALPRVGVPGEIWLPVAVGWKFLIFPHDRVARSLNPHPYDAPPTSMPWWWRYSEALSILAAAVQWTIVAMFCGWWMRRRKPITQVLLSITAIIIVGSIVFAALLLLGFGPMFAL